MYAIVTHPMSPTRFAVALADIERRRLEARARGDVAAISRALAEETELRACCDGASAYRSERSTPGKRTG